MRQIQQQDQAHPRSMKQRGQGLTEYIIIVALIAIAAITAVGIFGDGVRAQFGTMAANLTGTTGTGAGLTAATAAATTEAAKSGPKTLGDYADP